MSVAEERREELIHQAYQQCKWENEEEGHLNLYDNIECPICKNKGYILFVDNDLYIKGKDCKCKKRRNAINKLHGMGITDAMLERYQIQTYNPRNNCQVNAIRELADYVSSSVNGLEKNWLYVSGITGSGKTHLCTAIFQKFMEKNYDCEYLMWNEFIPKIVTLQRSTYTDSQEKCEKWFKRLYSVDVLYIDDFLKLTANNYKSESLSIAYRIINARYNDSNKITIISSELALHNLGEDGMKDEATMGRIKQRAGFGKYILSTGTNEESDFRNS